MDMIDIITIRSHAAASCVSVLDVMSSVLTQEYGERSPPAPPHGQPLTASRDVTARLPGSSNDSFVNTFTCNQHSTGVRLRTYSTKRGKCTKKFRVKLALLSVYYTPECDKLFQEETIKTPFHPNRSRFRPLLYSL